MKPVLTRLLPLFVSVCGLLLALLLAEIAVRAMTQKPGAAAWNDRPPFYYQHQESATLQDYPHNPQKAPNSFRLAVVGDSFSFAPYMQFTDAFPKKLEQMLNLNQTELRAEVINYGVPAFSTSHEVAKVAQALQEQADLVLLQITLNDPELKAGTPIGITNFSRFGPLQPGPWQQKLFAVSHLARLVAERLHNTRTQQEYIAYFRDLFENPKTWNPFQRAMRSIAKSCQDRKVPLVAVVFPLFGIALDEHYPFYPIHRKVAELLESLKVPHLDLSPYYRGIPLERLQVLPGVDRHPNEIGHRMAAERIYLWLVQKQLLPQELVIKLMFQNRTQIVKEKPYHIPEQEGPPL